MPKRLTPRGEAAPPVEPINTGASLPPRETVKKSTARKPKVTDNGVRYVRNLHGILTRITLGSGREIMLQPRGQREDLDIVNEAEQQDPKFLANRDLIFEVIAADQAQAIIYNQQRNSNQSTLFDHLRNEKGEAYQQTQVTVEPAFERQGTVVAKIEQTGSGRFTDSNVELVRAPTERTSGVPGSPGHPATEFMQSVPGDVAPEEYHEFLQWKQWKNSQKQASE